MRKFLTRLKLMVFNRLPDLLWRPGTVLSGKLSLLCTLECLSRVSIGNGESTHRLQGNLMVPRKILVANTAMVLHTAKLGKEKHINKSSIFLGTSLTELMKCFSYWSNKSSKFGKTRKSNGKGTLKNKEQQFSHQHRRGRTLSPGSSQLHRSDGFMRSQMLKSLVNCAEFGYMSPKPLLNVKQVNRTSLSLLETIKKGFIGLMPRCSVMYTCCDRLENKIREDHHKVGWWASSLLLVI